MSVTEIPKENWKDKSIALSKAMLSMAPPIEGIPVGSIIGELISLFVTTPHSKSMEKWMHTVAERIVYVESQIGQEVLLELIQKDEFTTYFAECCRIATKNHQEEKLLMLRNSFDNYFFKADIHFDKKYTFLRIVDELTVTHLSILNFIENNEGYIIHNIKDYENLYKLYIGSRPEIDRYFLRRCVRDLETQGLVRINNDFKDFIHGQGFASDTHTPSIKLIDLGAEFLQFVRESKGSNDQSFNSEQGGVSKS
ncbi:hypothetical protein BWI96_11820 [Siphonobacter sp. SORGH_AS_0500]|uniref:hypothetical protein n=1 Tax=Siphonobacter sp. SORGH_AS_0500 TaxID=1864824 RepID=UPI000CC90CEC|nr:hypothetical protein [Siphonobacter sp. SORGH_AS_0500]PKK36535.1 hypothetical protein BWI96_11820 [Siphonobacter sp. SORGH_AS_0500]